MGARLGVAAVDEALAEARGQAAGERDDALGVRRELAHVERRLAAVQALEEAGRGELDEVAVAGVVLGQQRQVVALAPLAPPRAVRVVVDEVDLAADDRLDAVLAGTPCRARPRRSSRRGRSGRAPAGRTPRRARRARRSCGAVEQRVLGVDVQMGAGRRAHRTPRIGGGAEGPFGRPGTIVRTLRALSATVEQAVQEAAHAARAGCAPRTRPAGRRHGGGHRPTGTARRGRGGADGRRGPRRQARARGRPRPPSPVSAPTAAAARPGPAPTRGPARPPPSATGMTARRRSELARRAASSAVARGPHALLGPERPVARARAAPRARRAASRPRRLEIRRRAVALGRERLLGRLARGEVALDVRAGGARDRR